jgi:membrane protein DedA with SNARE-associated domain
VTSFLDPVIALVSAHPWLAYLTLFLAALLEAIPVVGALVPGSTIILALSALVPGGELKLWGVLAAAIAGAVLGDGSAFWAGHRSQREILGAWPMSRYPGVMAQSEAFFHRWGTLAVFFARFVPPIRAFVPVTAGALGMPPMLFFGVNIPAVLAWALAHVLPGVLAVSALHEYAGLPHHQGAGKHLWMLAVFASAIIALGVWTLRRRRIAKASSDQATSDQALPGPRPGAGPT